MGRATAGHDSKTKINSPACQSKSYLMRFVKLEFVGNPAAELDATAKPA